MCIIRKLIHSNKFSGKTSVVSIENGLYANVVSWNIIYLMKRQIPLNEGPDSKKDHMQINRYVLAGVEQKISMPLCVHAQLFVRFKRL